MSNTTDSEQQTLEPMHPEEVEKFLAVGAIATFNPHPSRPQGQRFLTAVRGWKRGEYIILDMPARDSGGGIFFRDRQQCLIHFFYEGTACGFDSKVIENSRAVHPAEFWVTWPKVVHTAAVRQHERLKISLPCTLSDDRGTSCTGDIQDLSEGGCLAHSNVSFAKGMVLTVKLTLPDGTVLDPIRAEVRNMRAAPGGCLIGCAFRDASPVTQSNISFYLASAYALMRGQTTPGRRVVFIQQSTTHDSTLLKEATERFRVDLVVATGIVEGFHRLQVLRPLAVLLDVELRPDAIDLGTAIKQSHGFETMPVYIYGGDAQALAERIAAGKIDGQIPTVTDAKRIENRQFEMTLAGLPVSR